MTEYEKVKFDVLTVVDWASPRDVRAHYGAKYDAKTKLPQIVTPGMKRAMTKPLNDLMLERFDEQWAGVGELDVTSQGTIGSLIELVCFRAGVDIPAGEPS